MRSQIRYTFVKCGCLIYFSSILQTWYVQVRISWSYFRKSLGIWDNESHLYMYECMYVHTCISAKCVSFNLYQSLGFSEDEKLVILFLFFPGNRIWHFVQVIWMKGQNLFPGKNKKYLSKCHMLKIIPRVLSMNGTYFPWLCFSPWAFMVYGSSRDPKFSIFLITPPLS